MSKHSEAASPPPGGPDPLGAAARPRDDCPPARPHYALALGTWALTTAVVAALAFGYEIQRLEDDFQRRAAELERTLRHRLELTGAALSAFAFGIAALGDGDADVAALAARVLAQHPDIRMLQVLRRRALRARPNGAPAPDPAYVRVFAASPDPAGGDKPAPEFTALDLTAPERDTLASLRDALRRARSGEGPILAPVFGRATATAGHVLLHGVPGDPTRVAAAVVRGDDLLPEPSSAPERIALSHAGIHGAPETFAVTEGRPAAGMAQRLLPRFRRRVTLSLFSHELDLAIERRLVAADLAGAPLGMLLGLGTLGLLAALGAARARHRWQSAALEEQAQLAYRATHDPLTGLPNRALFLDRFEHARALAQRTGALLALLVLDLDGFKQINDTLGHATGDAVLRAVAARLSVHLRRGDTLARFGGDEFVVLIEGIRGLGGAAEAADHILRALRRPAVAGGLEVTVRASIGIAVFPADGDDFGDLFAAADQAMYLAKRLGCGRYHRQLG